MATAHGMGKKTAQRMILELKGTLQDQTRPHGRSAIPGVGHDAARRR